MTVVSTSNAAWQFGQSNWCHSVMRGRTVWSSKRFHPGYHGWGWFRL